MPKELLTDRHVKAAKPRTKSYRLADGGGLYLYIPPTGVSAWQLRYRHDGRQQTATLGKLEFMSLSEAREEARTKRKLAAQGAQLTVEKRLAKARKRTQHSNTFDGVKAAWIAAEAR